MGGSAYPIDEHGDSHVAHIKDVNEFDAEPLPLSVYATDDHEVEVWVGLPPFSSMFTLSRQGATTLGHALLDAVAEAERREAEDNP